MSDPRALPRQDASRCVNCGTERDDLVTEGPGCPPLCPTIADCDRTLYYRAAIEDHRWWEERYVAS